MSTQLINEFSEWELSETEINAGSIFNGLQLQVLQNHRARIAKLKLALVFTPTDVSRYTQQEAELTGQLGMINYLLEIHQAVLTNMTDTFQQEENQSNPSVQFDKF